MFRFRFMFVEVFIAVGRKLGSLDLTYQYAGQFYDSG